MKTICIMCPMGCPLNIESVNGEVKVTGNTCPRGAKYGVQEFTEPKRVVTSLVKLKNGGVVSVKTNDLVPKKLIPDILEEIKKVTLIAPCRIGDVVIKNILDTGADLVVTSNIG